MVTHLCLRKASKTDRRLSGCCKSRFAQQRGGIVTRSVSEGLITFPRLRVGLLFQQPARPSAMSKLDFAINRSALAPVHTAETDANALRLILATLILMWTNHHAIRERRGLTRKYAIPGCSKILHRVTRLTRPKPALRPYPPVSCNR